VKRKERKKKLQREKEDEEAARKLMKDMEQKQKAQEMNLKASEALIKNLADEEAARKLLDREVKSGKRLPLDQHNLRVLKKHKYGDKYECQVCFTEYPIDKIIALKCEHFLCLTCMQQYIVSKFKDGNALGLACFTPSCKNKIELVEARYCLTKKELEQYEGFLLDAVLRQDPNCRWCPKKRMCHSNDW